MFDWIVSGFRFLVALWGGIIFLTVLWFGWCLWFRRGIRATPIPAPAFVPEPVSEPVAESEPTEHPVASGEAVPAVQEPSQLTGTVQSEQESLASPAPPAVPMASSPPAPATPVAPEPMPAVPMEPSPASPIPPIPPVSSVPVLRAEDLPPDTLCELPDGTVVTLAIVDAWRKLQLRWLALPQELR